MKKKEKIQCHFISNTHWDREWRFSAQRTRYMLVYLLDMLFDIFEKDPKYKSFHLDSQTLPIQDYLEARPEKKELVRKYVKNKKLYIGPWFCLPDEFCVGGESLIRNLLLGHKMGKKYGKVSKTGYSPFSWGQISQMPQIYKGFGIDMIAFYRGINNKVAPNSEFFWEGPDGSKIVGSRLAERPRYNAWYVIQRPLFFNLENENERHLAWEDGNGPFKFIDSDNYHLDYKFVHPKYEYHKETIPKRADQAIKEQDGQWSTLHRLWSLGHDSSCPDIRESEMIKDCNKALKEGAEVFHSNFEAFQKGVVESVDPDLPVLEGEMRYPFTKGSASTLYGYIISARTYIKQDNFITERAIISYTEPLAVFASLLGAPYPLSFIDMAYNWLLQNHGHDSIGSCSRDIVHNDMLFRSSQAREICSCVMERALMDISGSIKLVGFDKNDMAIVVYNPTPFTRCDVIEAYIDIPEEWESSKFEITDQDDNKVSFQEINRIKPNFHITQNPNDCANTYAAIQVHCAIDLKDIPSMGYKTFRVKPVESRELSESASIPPSNPLNKFGIKRPGTGVTGPDSMENEFISVKINSNGTLNITDKKTEKQYENMGYFQDMSEIGNPWEHITVENETVFTTLEAKAEVKLEREGSLESVFSVEMDWALPKGRSKDEKTRSNELVPYKIKNRITLRKGTPWVEVVTEFDNKAEDHYLQVCFPTKINTDEIMVQGQFDVIKRSIPKPSTEEGDEKFQTEEPMNSFIDLSDGKNGLAILNEGLKAYETFDDEERTVHLTLIRSFPLRICVTDTMTDYSDLDKGSQNPGPQSFKYALMPHADDWEKANIWQASERFTLGLKAVQLGVTDKGTEPLSKSFLEITPENLHVSAVKRNEANNGWVVRLFNPSTQSISGKIRLNNNMAGPVKSQSPVERVKNEFKLPKAKQSRWKKVRLVTLEELPEKDLKMDTAGWADFIIGKKKILTIEFL